LGANAPTEVEPGGERYPLQFVADFRIGLFTFAQDVYTYTTDQFGLARFMANKGQALMTKPASTCFLYTFGRFTH
jgi:hypothetical protein